METAEQFIDSIDSRDPPTLHFLHLTLPHSPTIYLPSGKAYEEIENILVGGELATDYWDIDGWKVTQAFQRHLLQVGFVDRFIGSLIQKMKQEGIYDKALLIVTADHGISFLPGHRARAFTPFNYPDILSVPLFIKLPGQKKGAVRDEAVETIDILPTIAGSLDIDVPWKLDGENPFKPKPEGWKNENVTRQLKLKNIPTVDALKFPQDPQQKYETLKKKYILFGSGPEELLYRTGPGNELLGMKAEEALQNKLILKTQTQLDKIGPVVHVDPESNFIPSWITGRVVGFPKENNVSPQWLAISVNGIIQATTQTSFLENTDRFSALLPEKSFKKGNNHILVFRISQEAVKVSYPKNSSGNDNSNYDLGSQSYIWNKDRSQYRLFQRPDDSLMIMFGNGNTYEIPEAQAGQIETIQYSPEAIYFQGHFGDWKNREGSIKILLFSGQNLVYADDWINPQVFENNASKNPQSSTRLVLRVPVYQNKKANLSNIRIFLVDEKESVQEIGIPPYVLSSFQNNNLRHFFYGALSYCQGPAVVTGNRDALKNPLKTTHPASPGRVDRVYFDDRQKVFRFKGMAVDKKTFVYPEKALILVNGKMIASTRVGPRPSGKQTTRNRPTRNIDFKIDVPLEHFKNPTSDRVQVYFSYKNKKRTELEYSKFFPWTDNPCF